MSVLDWASNAGRRLGAVALELTGFVEGNAVSPLALNDILGRITDWIRLQQNGVITLQPGALVWRAGGQGAITNTGVITLTLASNGTGTGNAASLPFYASKVSPEFRIAVGDVDDNSTLSVFIFSPGATSVSRYAVVATPADADTTVTLAYSPQAAPLDGPDEFAPGDSLGFSASINGTTGEKVEINAIELDFT